MDMRRRSSLYVPCDVPRMLTKAATVPADQLILNLEDGVSEARKDLARENLVRALHGNHYGKREVVVRVNPIDTAHGQKDLAVVVPLRPDGICLPKVESAADVQAAALAVASLEEKGSSPIPFHAMIESAAGVLRSAEIGISSPRLRSLVFGSADYCKDLGCTPGPERVELTMALQQIVTAARAAGVDAIDAPCFEVRNLELLRSEATQARRYGYDGKGALHPGQIEVIHEVFNVTPLELEWARKVLGALEGAEKKGRALTTVDGQLVDNPHAVAARRILKRASETS